MLARAVAVFGRAPGVAAKTRLAPPLSLDAAARLAAAFQRDTLAVALSVSGASVCFVHPPAPDPMALATLLPPGVAAIEEREADLGGAMLAAFHALFAGGAETVVLIGSDLPTVPAKIIESAFGVLEQGEADVALGPAEDGGYYLIGARAPHPALFASIPWGGADVLARTLDRADAAGLRVARLATWWDIDRPDDLARLVHDLAAAPASVAPATRRALADLGLATV